jgi:hypothetical protein
MTDYGNTFPSVFTVLYRLRRRFSWTGVYKTLHDYIGKTISSVKGQMNQLAMDVKTIKSACNTIA